MDNPRQPADEHGISLDQLTAAFAEMLDSGGDPYTDAAPADQAAGEEADLSEAVAAADTEQNTEVDAACEISPRSILEAMLFVGHPQNEPLTSERIAGLMRGVRPAEIDDLVRELNAEYASNRCPYVIRSAGAGYQMSLRPEFHRIREKFYGRAKQARLSTAAIEVLALVAYNEPISADDISKQRGAASKSLLTQLVHRQLLQLQRLPTDPPTTVYFTTPRFLKLFSLSSLEDLPRSQDLEPR